ncbi:MAG: hypothetical protein ACLVEJ_04685 [Parabacteroides sp.]
MSTAAVLASGNETVPLKSLAVPAVAASSLGLLAALFSVTVRLAAPDRALVKRMSKSSKLAGVPLLAATVYST